MKGIYLGAFKALHLAYDLVYQDINGERDLGGDMMDIDLSNYDFIVATPPCNFWSRANYRRYSSEYSLRTRHLLPGILHKLILLNKPFIVENVRNKKMFSEYGLFDLPCYVYFVGRHTYWSNIKLDFSGINQVPLTDYKDGKKRYLSSQNLPRHLRQGGNEVHECIDVFLSKVNLPG